MCWIGKKEEAIRLEAKKDIEVFKIIYKTEKKKYISLLLTETKKSESLLKILLKLIRKLIIMPYLM